MLLIPAIDLKDGHCVRLKQGDMDQSTTFGEDPEVMARSWLASALASAIARCTAPAVADVAASSSPRSAVA